MPARRALKRIAAPVLGLLLIPTGAGSLLAAAQSLGALARHGAHTGWFLAGLALYGVLHAGGWMRMRRAYVLAHELTHALAASLCGAKVLRFVVRKDSGYVDLSHVNAFSALAPYWIPLYTLTLVAVYRLLLWISPPPYHHEAFLLLMGLTLSFHLCHTIHSLWTSRQSDLDHAGLTLSFAAIMLLNAALVLAAVKCLFPGLVSLRASAWTAWDFTAGFWRWAALATGKGADWLASR